MDDKKNVLLAVVLIGVVLIGWQYLFAVPQLEKQKQIALQQHPQGAQLAQNELDALRGRLAQLWSPPAGAKDPQELTVEVEIKLKPDGTLDGPPQVLTSGTSPLFMAARDNAMRAIASGQPYTMLRPEHYEQWKDVVITFDPRYMFGGEKLTREAIISSSPRIRIDTPRLSGSLALMGGRIDDLALVQYHTVLLSPSGSPQPYYAEFGWTGAAGTSAKLPGPDTLWRQEGAGALSVGHPVTLVYDNGQGLQFRRIVNVDDKYVFTIKDGVANNAAAAVTLYPYALVSRHGTPPTLSYYIRHEGFIGVLGEQGLKELTYKKIEEQKDSSTFDVTNAWLGFTDDYWAATLLPETDAKVHAKFSFGLIGQTKTYQTDYLLDPQTIAPGSTGSADARLFAGAKEVAIVGINFPLGGSYGYNQQLNLNHFDLLIDWGWFFFITKPMFLALDLFSHLVGNFGLAILAVTLILKLIFFPFANQSYRSMIKMQRLQPQIVALRERFPEQDRVNEQIMELYKSENVKAPSGCLPMVIQALAFWSLYKVFLVTIESHVPFGWVRDLAAADQTNVFNLFGLIDFDPTALPVAGSILHLGALPIILGLTVWLLQRKLSPILLGSFQRKVYAALPIIVVYFSAHMMAGYVIFFAFYNCLSIIHQLLLMKKEKDVVGNISEYSAKLLPYGKIQPVVFLVMLAPILQNLLTVLVFWRRSENWRNPLEVFRQGATATSTASSAAEKISMTQAVCFKCGEMKAEPLGSCDKCGTRPISDDELMLSLAFTDHRYDQATLEGIGQKIKLGTVYKLDEKTKTDLLPAVQKAKVPLGVDQDHLTREPPPRRLRLFHSPGLTWPFFAAVAALIMMWTILAGNLRLVARDSTIIFGFFFGVLSGVILFAIMRAFDRGRNNPQSPATKD